MLKNNMEKLSPLLLVFLLIGSIIGIGLSYATTNPQLNELKNQLEDQNSMISNIEKEKEIDKNKISEMEREIIVLNDEISNNKIDIIKLETKISQKDEDLNEINNIWKIWEEHKELSPRNNFGYRYNDPGGGSCLGNCMVSIQSLIIPFKDVKDCMIWARFTGTGSMRPVIYKDTITIGIKSKCLDPSEINKGDMIIFNGKRIFDSEQAIGHQVIDTVVCSNDMSKTCYITKGIYNNHIDPKEVRFEEVIMKITLINF